MRATLVSLLVALAAPLALADAPRPFTATAYALAGRTATGSRARSGIVAADPAELPLGSRIRISGAGRYSGEYVVEDTGAAVRGRVIDIHLGSQAEARRFGRRRVGVEILERGAR
jgi:3D (Asp-Asp-Asp) domain-containing protein